MERTVKVCIVEGIHSLPTLLMGILVSWCTNRFRDYRNDDNNFEYKKFKLLHKEEEEEEEEEEI